MGGRGPVGVNEFQTHLNIGFLIQWIHQLIKKTKTYPTYSGLWHTLCFLAVRLTYLMPKHALQPYILEFVQLIIIFDYVHDIFYMT